MPEVSGKERKIRMNKQSKWPFKHLSQKSSWPMQGLVVQFAAAVIQTPSEARKEAAEKMVERCFRMGARLALEFGMSPVRALRVAQEQIEREIPGAKPAIADAKIAEHDKVSEMADALVSGELSNLFGAKEKGEA